MTTTNQGLARSEIKAKAKTLVLRDGPSNVLEFGREMMSKYGWTDDYDATDVAAILTEARVQACRVYVFLGYVPPTA